MRGFGEQVIAGCVAEKLAVVARDEREESGERAVLNLGHTIGHAIEAATGFRRYTHGEAVGLGLRAALWLSERLCGLSGAEVERGLALLDAIGLPLRFRGAGPEAVRELTSRDKKAGAGRGGGRRKAARRASRASSSSCWRRSAGRACACRCPPACSRRWSRG